MLCQERKRLADSPGGSQLTVNDTLLECGLRLSIPQAPTQDRKRSKGVVDTVACLDMLGLK